MEIKVTGQQVADILLSLLLGSGIGYLAHLQYSKVHTPESKIQELNEARIAYETSKREAQARSYEARREREKLASTKKQYQDEIRPEIESKIRKELQTYISQAETSYENAKKIREEAKHEREIADLKLELAKTLNESVTHTEKETKIIVKSANDIEEDDE